MTGENDVVLCDGELLPCRDAHLPLHQVDSGDHLGDRVFNLEAGIHFHEEELIRRFSGNEELHRAGPDVVDTACRVARRLSDPGTGCRIQQR